MKFKDFEYNINNETIYIPNWEIKNNESWAIIGNNGSGKTLLGKLLSEINIKKQIGYISFEKVEEILEIERKNDDMDFMDKEDPGTLVKEFITNKNRIFDIESIKDRGLKYLSTGELVKVLIIKELENSPDYLILDEPYDGLDIESQKILFELIGNLIKSNITIILVLNREEDIHKDISHIAFIHENRVTLTGNKDEILNSESFKNIRHFSGNIPDELPGLYDPIKNKELLIDLKRVNISFGDTKVLKDISWSVYSGEHYKIIGPNGSGKSTLLKIISADNHQSYGQEITLFGYKRGCGESIWDIKKNIGLVSSSLQKDYRVSVSVLSVILSGFYDSIGLYNEPNPWELEQAKEWLQIVGLSSKIEMLFKELSYGEQRLILIIRAMVKHPKVLILDEPCLGLDQVNREVILMLLGLIAVKGETTLLYVSHRKEDFIPSIKKEIHLIPTNDGSIGELI